MASDRGERQAVLRRVRSVAKRYSTGKARMDALEEERTAVYREARALVPPITFATLAREFGVTEAAIMQKLNRRDERDAATAANRPRRPRSPRKRLDMAPLDADPVAGS